MKLKNEINGFVSDGDGGYTAKNMGNRSHRRGLETKIYYNINKHLIYLSLMITSIQHSLIQLIILKSKKLGGQKI